MVACVLGATNEQRHPKIETANTTMVVHGNDIMKHTNSISTCLNDPARHGCFRNGAMEAGVEAGQ
jgi:hypothetical protein